MNYGKISTLEDIIELAKLLESISAPLRFHVALTGGQLYKEGKRKDIDFIVYGELEGVDKEQDIDWLIHIWSDKIPELEVQGQHGYVTKVTWSGYDVDFLYPEYDGENSYEEFIKKLAQEGKAKEKANKPIAAPKGILWPLAP